MLAICYQVGIALILSAGPGKDEPATDQPAVDEASLVTSLKEADLIFTGTLAKVHPLGQTNSIPASIFGAVTFKNLKPLRGSPPAAATFSYSYREGLTKNLDLTPDAQVLAAAKGKAVIAIVPATDANLALAKKTLTAAEK